MAEVRVIRVVAVAKEGPQGQPAVPGSDLDVLENLVATGIAVRTANTAWALRTIVSASLLLTNANGVAGDIGIELPANLVAINALAGVGWLKKTAPNVWALGVPTAAEVGADPAGTSAAAMAAHLAAADPHPQYRLESQLVTWAEITGKPTTLAGFGILDAYTKVEADARYAPIAGGGYQPLDADLTAIAALAANGIAVQTAVGAWAQRTITGTANRVAVTNGSGVVGNPTIDIDAAYVGQATITTVGLVAAGTWAAGFPNGGGVLATGEMGIRGAAATDRTLQLLVASSAATSIFGAVAVGATPLTAVVEHTAYSSQIGTVNAAFSLSQLNHFKAATTNKGALSTITALRGFYAANAIAVGVNNYGFYSDINSATNTWQLHMSGTAGSQFNGAISIGNASYTFGAFIVATMPATVTDVNPFQFKAFASFPATTTGQASGFISTATLAAAAFVAGAINHFDAAGAALGAGSSATIVRGFYARNSIALGVSDYGFYSDINAAANTWQLFLLGTASSYFGAPIALLNGDLSQTHIIKMGQSSVHPGTGTTVYGAYLHMVSPATATTAFVSYESNNVATAAAAFTLTNVWHFNASGVSVGVGSTITNVMGFRASNGIANGVNNYGFYSNINNATNTWQLYMTGSAPNHMGGPLALLTTAGVTQAIVTIGLNNNHPSTLAAIYGVYMQLNAPATATSGFFGFWSRLDTVAAAFVCPNVVHFEANNTTVGAGSTVTNVYAFRALNAVANGTNNYGFWSNINVNGTTTFQLNMSGTAHSRFGGPVGIGVAIPSGTEAWLSIGLNSGHFSAATTAYACYSETSFPATTTVAIIGYHSRLNTTAAAYTVTAAAHFSAALTNLGAASAITSVYGFRALNAIAVGVNNYGFYSDINVATLTYQLYMGGTAPSLFGGALIEKEIVVTYSAAMTIDARLGNEQIITVTNAVAWTVNAPTTPSTGQYLEITVRNTSGGALGAATWNAVFKMNAWVSPANGFSRTIAFRYNGTNWVEKGRTAADVPN